MVQREICADSGLLPNPLCPHRRSEWFYPGREPTQVCDMHRIVQLDSRTGIVASVATPVEYIREEPGMVLPPEAAECVRDGVPKRAAGAKVVLAASGEPEEGPPSSAPRVIVSYPEHNTTYRLSPTVPLESQLIEIRAVPLAVGEIVEVRLYADEQLLASLDAPPYTVLWQLAPGEHLFRAEAVSLSGEVWSSQAVSIDVLTQ